MQNITINNANGTVIINYNVDTTEKAKDELLEKLYYARNKDTMGGYKAWIKLLDMYYMQDYQGMIQFIKSCRGRGGKTRNECIKKLETIIGGNK